MHRVIKLPLTPFLKKVLSAEVVTADQAIARLKAEPFTTYRAYLDCNVPRLRVHVKQIVIDMCKWELCYKVYSRRFVLGRVRDALGAIISSV